MLDQLIHLLATGTRTAAGQASAAGRLPGDEWGLMVASNEALCDDVRATMLAGTPSAAVAKALVGVRLPHGVAAQVATTEKRSSVLAAYLGANPIDEVLLGRMETHPKLVSDAVSAALITQLGDGTMDIDLSDRLIDVGREALPMLAAARVGSRASDDTVAARLATMKTWWPSGRVRASAARPLLAARPGLLEAFLANENLHTAVAGSHVLAGQVDVQRRLSRIDDGPLTHYDIAVGKYTLMALVANPYVDLALVEDMIPVLGRYFALGEVAYLAKRRVDSGVTLDPTTGPRTAEEHSLYARRLLGYPSGVNMRWWELPILVKSAVMDADRATDIVIACDASAEATRSRTRLDDINHVVDSTAAGLRERYGLDAPEPERYVTGTRSRHDGVRACGVLLHSAHYWPEDVTRMFDDAFGEDHRRWDMAWNLLATADAGATVAEFTAMVTDITG